MITPDLCTRLDVTLNPDPGRVIVRLFVSGEDAALVGNRASAIIERDGTRPRSSPPAVRAFTGTSGLGTWLIELTKDEIHPQPQGQR